MNDLKKLLGSKGGRKILARIKELDQKGESLSGIRKKLKEEFAGSPWLELIMQLLPILLKFLQTLIKV